MRHKLQKLEALRGLAATYVFVSHMMLERVLAKGSAAGVVFRFGQQAVMLFFLLSGFVIYYSTVKHRDPSFRGYFIRRFRRIYPIFLLALLLSYAAYALSVRDWPAIDPLQLIGNLVMLQDFGSAKPGVWVQPFCANTPLWSLSYEWWFYMMFFPIYRRVRPSLQLHFVAALSFAGWATYALLPNQISLYFEYFFLWWIGAEVAKNYIEGTPVTFVSQWKTLAYLAGLTACLSIPVVNLVLETRALPNPGVHPLLEVTHFGSCLVLLAGGLLWARLRWVGFWRILGVFTFAAPVSYALYVFHYPVAITSSYLSGVGNVWVQIVVYTVITIVLAYLAERPIQRLINRLIRD